MNADQGRTPLATALRRWRLRRRVSQLELALQVRTTQRYVSFIETGRSVPGTDLELITTLTHFGTAVDVTLAELRLEAFLPADPATAAALARFDRFH